ncbi:MAG TPA: sugar ABC transporter permease [Candidatus Limnocylindrales bacterium]|nr:sugar ABC transporter permease [Candidatus Limnocylindrales bacterium]
MEGRRGMVKRVRRREVGLRTRRRLSISFKVLLAIVTAIYALIPVAFVITAALNPLNTITAASLLPTRVTFEHFETIFSSPTHPWPTWILNSVTVAGITAVLVTALCALAAYSFSRFRFRGRRAGLISLVIIQLFPNMLAMVALFLLLQAVGQAMPTSAVVPLLGEIELPRLGLNSLGGLILIYSGGALGFNTWLMKAYFDTVPYDLDESALVDGASHTQVFRMIVLPLVRPILAVIGILTFIGTYSDFLIARIMLSSPENYTVAVGMSLFITGQFTQRWGVFAAAAVISALPIVITFLILQRQLIGGLAQGGVKG